MTKEHVCCGKFENLFQEGNVVQLNGSYYIFGRPVMVNDGDGHMDDITEELRIEFCPFCGDSIVPFVEEA